MSEEIKYFLYTLNKNPIVHWLYIQYYKLALFFFKLIIGNLNFIECLFLKGSFGTKDFIPVISDLDFFIIGERNKKNEQILKKRVGFLNFIFPMISDYDFQSKTEAEFLFQFSGMKYFSVNKWRTLKGYPLSCAYQFYPRKFYIDIIHEIYFQMEWLFKNLKQRNRGDKLRSLNLQRQFDKIVDLINYLGDNKNSFDLKRKAFVENKRWIYFSNEAIIIKFNSYIERSQIMTDFRKIYQYEFYDRSINEIVKKDYFKKQLTIYTDDFKYDGRLHYYTKDNFELFYYAGSIDSYLLWDWCEFTNDKFGKNYIKCLYFTRLLEKRANSKHGYSFYLDNLSNIKEIKKNIRNKISIVSPLKNIFFGRNVLVVTNPKSEFPSIKMDMIDSFAISLKSSFNRNDQSNDLPQLFIKEREFSKDLNYNMTLLNLAIHWCFGARLIILSEKEDLDLNPGTIKTIGGHCINGKFVEILNNSFCWAASYLQFRRIYKLPDKSFGHFTSELFKYQITSQLSTALIENYIVERLDPFSTEEYEIESIIRDNPPVEFDPQEQDKFQIGLLSLFSNGLQYNDFGIIEKGEYAQDYWGMLMHLRNLFELEDNYELLGCVEQIISDRDDKSLRFLELSFSKFWRLLGLGVILKEKSESIRFRSGSKLTRLPFDITNNWSIQNLKPGEIVYFQITIDGEITVKNTALTLRTNSFENIAQKIYYEGDNLYRMEGIFIVPSDNRFMFLNFQLELERNCTYSINVKNKKTYSFKNDSSLSYYKNEKLFIKAQSTPLKLLHRGFYKIVVNFPEPVSTTLYITDNFNGSYYQQYHIIESNQLVLYHLVINDSESYFINFSKPYSTTKSIDVDFLRVNGFT